MILYNHYYNEATNRIEITSVEVSKTEKTYRTQNSTLLRYRKTVKKSEIDILISDYGLYMVSTTPSAMIFHQKIIGYYKEMHRLALEKLTKAEFYLSRAKECTIARSTEAAE
ncbi:hypothetical protein FMM68_11040 [Lachnospiraceae bacterium MD329]|nr:hypothetical protein [Lachnospiraceae bacterium MD329]